MRKACSGPLYRLYGEAILETVDQGLDLAGTQFTQSALDGRAAAQLRVWRGQPFPCVLLIVPYSFSGGDSSSETLGAFALDDAQFAVATFVGRLGHDAIQATVRFPGYGKHPAHGDAESGLRQSFADNFFQVFDRGHGLAEDGPSTHHFGDALGFNHEASWQVSLCPSRPFN